MMRHVRCFVCVFVIAFGLSSVCAAEDAAAAFQTRVLPVLKTHCGRCHGNEKQEAKINLSVARDSAQLAADREVWFRVLNQLESGEMPPADEKQPSKGERQTIVGWIRGDFTDMLIAKQRQEGRSKLRRLTRSEYVNTFQDLFGIRPTVGINLPEDGRVDGYDKVSVALPLSSSGAAGYFKMSEDLLNWVLKPVPRPKAPNGETEPSRVVRAPARPSGESAGQSLDLPDGTIISFNSDTSSGGLTYGTRVPGMHKVRISVYGYQTDKPLAFGIYAGHTSAYPQLLDLVKVLEAPPGKAAVVEAEIYLRSRDLNDRSPVSDSLRLIPFGLGVQVPKNSYAKNCSGPGLAVQWMDIEEPELPIQADRWLTADFPPALIEELRRSSTIPADRQIALQKIPNPKNQAKSTNREEFLAVMRATLVRVGARLFRRDLSAAELDQHMTQIAQQVDDGVSLEAIFFGKITELLTSPDFLCVVEPAGQLTDFALAARLSYFLWNSTPDEALMEVARQGKLRDPRVLREQTERLLNDPKSNRFMTDFVNQWLGLRAIDDTSPDRNLYPEYDEFLKLSSARETEGFFRKVLDENLSVRSFVDSSWVLVNEELAKHYGLPDVIGSQLRKVDLPKTSPYGGLWTQSAVMKVTANGTNTSPVKRGVWVAERLLGIRIPPPPPNINPVEPDVRGAKTLREQLALHRGSGSCAACHAKFDPYGFALESFDVTGGFRANYREVNPEVVAIPAHQRKGRLTWRDGLPVDASGETPDGQKFSGISGLRQALSKNPEQLARGVTRHLVTYATGTPPTGLDQPAIERIVKSAAEEDYGLRSLVHAIVQSELFGWK
jgi:mono/diheme cytochrome c family protein